jgi:hypothetical protein
MRGVHFTGVGLGPQADRQIKRVEGWKQERFQGGKYSFVFPIHLRYQYLAEGRREETTRWNGGPQFLFSLFPCFLSQKISGITIKKPFLVYVCCWLGRRRIVFYFPSSLHLSLSLPYGVSSSIKITP